MTRAAELELENWTRYRGSHKLELGPGVHAVVAAHVRDAGRSNWLGKTSFLYAFRFVLYGEHLARIEDEWITDGEKHGMVRTKLDDGTLIERSRHRGKSTVLRLVEVDGTERRGDEAQKRIDEIVGLGAGDFSSVCFFEQKKLSRFVTAQPAERMKTVSEWLNLDEVSRCEDNVSRRLGELLDRDSVIVRRLDVLTELLTESRSKLGGEEEKTDLQEEADLDQRLHHAEQEAGELRAEAERVQRELDDLNGWAKDAARARRYAEVCAQGIALKAKAGEVDEAKFDAELSALVEESEKRKLGLDEARRKRDEAKRLAAGEFDGQCPVMRKACPAAAAVVEVTTSNRTLVLAADKALKEAERACIEPAAAVGRARIKRSETKELSTQLAGLRGQAVELQPSAEVIEARGDPPDSEESRQRVDVAWAKSNAATMRHEEAKRHAENLRKHKAERARLAEQRERLGGEIATHREALVVFGRNGAQRRIAEGVLAEIEADANALLAESGIDLRIEVKWSREAAGKGELAPACYECGEPFPRGRAAKTCSRCGAKRAPKTVDKLELEMSDRSGAAEDLAGISFQLAAASWLRWERGTSWSACFIDEPFGSLDASNRRALASKLGSMLGGRFGFDQAFVVSHSPDVNDRMPQRVEIVADEGGSRLKS